MGNGGESHLKQGAFSGYFWLKQVSKSW